MDFAHLEAYFEAFGLPYQRNQSAYLRRIDFDFLGKRISSAI